MDMNNYTGREMAKIALVLSACLLISVPVSATQVELVSGTQASTQVPTQQDAQEHSRSEQHLSAQYKADFSAYLPSFESYVPPTSSLGTDAATRTGLFYLRISEQ